MKSIEQIVIDKLAEYPEDYFFLKQKYIEHFEKQMEANAKIKELEVDLEILRMQLVGCGVATLLNTEKSKVDRIAKDNPYYSASYKDVCDAVDREIELRAKLEIAVEALEFYGNRESWSTYNFSKVSHYKDTIVSEDVETIRTSKTSWIYFGGKQARQALKEIEEMK